MGGNGSSVDGYEYNWWFRQKGFVYHASHHVYSSTNPKQLEGYPWKILGWGMGASTPMGSVNIEI